MIILDDSAFNAVIGGTTLNTCFLHFHDAIKQRKLQHPDSLYVTFYPFLVKHIWKAM